MSNDARRAAQKWARVLNLQDHRLNEPEWDIFGPNFLFGKQCQKERLAPMFAAYVETKYAMHDYSAADLVYRSDLTSQERQHLFPSLYDIGNTDFLAPYKCKNAALVDAAKSVGLVLRSEGLEPAERGIERLCGSTYPRFLDAHPARTARLTLHVHRALQDDHHFVSRQELPRNAAEASLEAGNRFQFGYDTQRRWDDADFYCLLAAAIPTERVDEIDNTFKIVRPAIDRFLSQLWTVLTKGCSVAQAVVRYDKVARDWLTPAPTVRRIELPPDEHMLIHGHVLDYMHIALVEQRLRAEMAHEDVPNLSQALFAHPPMARDHLDRYAAPLEAWLTAVKPGKVSRKALRERLNQVPTLLRYFFLAKGTTIPAQVGADVVLAALVLEDRLRRSDGSTTAAHVHGEKNTTKSIRLALRDESTGAEEFGRAAAYRMNRLLYQLHGRTALHDAVYRLKLGLLERVGVLLSTHDTERVRDLFANMTGYLDHNVPLLIGQTAQPNRAA